MKKTNFLKGLAMAAIALVSVFTTSCSEEELNIKGTTIPEAAPAKVQLAISVVDLQNSKTLAQTIEDVTTKMGTTYSVACPAFAEKSQYTTTKNIEVQVPTIEKGQAVIIPVTFYVVSLNSALKDAMEDSDVVVDENAEVSEVEIEAEIEGAEDLEVEGNTITNTTGEDVTITVSLPYVAGYEYRTVSKSIVDDFANLKFTELVYEEKITIPANYMVEIIASQDIIPVTLDVIVDGKVVTVPLWEAGEFKKEIKFTSIDHDFDHDFGHGHGNGNNAGGGEGEAE